MQCYSSSLMHVTVLTIIIITLHNQMSQFRPLVQIKELILSKLIKLCAWMNLAYTGLSTVIQTCAADYHRDWRLKLMAARWNAYFSNGYTNYNAKTLARFGLQSVPKIKQVVEINDQSEGLFSACFFVNSSAFFINFFLSFVYSSAKSPRSGCSGSGVCTRATRAWITEKGKNSRLI